MVVVLEGMVLVVVNVVVLIIPVDKCCQLRPIVMCFFYIDITMINKQNNILMVFCLF